MDKGSGHWVKIKEQLQDIILPRVLSTQIIDDFSHNDIEIASGSLSKRLRVKEASFLKANDQRRGEIVCLAVVWPPQWFMHSMVVLPFSII